MTLLDNTERTDMYSIASDGGTAVTVGTTGGMDCYFSTTDGKNYTKVAGDHGGGGVAIATNGAGVWISVSDSSPTGHKIS